MSDKNSQKFGVIGVLFLWAFEVRFVGGVRIHFLQPSPRSNNALNNDLTFLFYFISFLSYKSKMKELM